MKISHLILAMGALLTPLLVSCSNDDPMPAPDVQEQQFAPLEEICGGQPWESYVYSYYTPDGCNVSLTEHPSVSIDWSYCFYVKDGSFYWWQKGLVDGKLRVYKYSYRFDRNTGYIYLNDADKPAAQMVGRDNSANVLLMRGNYDNYVLRYHLTGLPRHSDYIEGSYGQFIMKPVTDATTLAAIYNPDNIVATCE